MNSLQQIATEEIEMRDAAVTVETPWPTPTAAQRAQRHLSEAERAGLEVTTDMNSRLDDLVAELEHLSNLNALPTGVRQGYGRIAYKVASELLSIRQIQGRRQ